MRLYLNVTYVVKSQSIWLKKGGRGRWITRPTVRGPVLYLGITFKTLWYSSFLLRSTSEYGETTPRTIGPNRNRGVPVPMQFSSSRLHLPITKSIAVRIPNPDWSQLTVPHARPYQCRVQLVEGLIQIRSFRVKQT